MLIDGLRPAETMAPVSVAALAAAVATAHQAGLAIVPVGGGTHLDLGNRPTRYDWAVSTRELTVVRAHAPADLTATLEAGLTLAAVQRLLASYGQFLPLDAEDPERATIGGLIGAGVTGPQRLGYGTLRDRLLWAEVVTADGTVTQAGAKVVKSVAGYDLPKLQVGAVGSLGIVTAACFKLQPLPAVRRVVVMGADDPDGLAPVLDALLDGRLHPSLVTVVHGPGFEDPWTLTIGAEGADEATAWQVEKLLDLARAYGLGAMALEGPLADTARQALMGGRRDGDVRLRLVVLPDRVPALLAQLAQASPRSIHAEAANGVVRVAWDTHPGETAWRDAADIAVSLGGHWVLEACPTPWKVDGLDVWGPARPDRPLMARLKRVMDPTGTLAPGRAIGG